MEDNEQGYASPPLFYHNFPRPGTRSPAEVAASALSVLRSILANGLLLTPELLESRERLTDGTDGRTVVVQQKRVCFTLLNPDEVAIHALIYGPFALEFDLEGLLGLQATPVWYLPTGDGARRGGDALLARLGEIEDVLERLTMLRTWAASQPTGSEMVDFTINGRRCPSQLTATAVLELIPFLTHQSQPVEQLRNTLRGVAGLFAPLQKPSDSFAIQNYRLREWRVIGNQTVEGRPLTVGLLDDQKRAIAKTSPEFFLASWRFRSGHRRVIDECQLLPGSGNRHILEVARRVIVPRDSQDAVRCLLDSLRQPPPVVALDEL